MPYSLLVHPWGGALTAVAVIATALLVHRARKLKYLGYLMLAAGLLLFAGSLYTIHRNRQLQAAHPAPGKLVDIGGYKLHLLAEGSTRAGRTVVWIPGGHSQGYALFHLHKALRAETRSILYDRAGTGWSDSGPFPRTTAREAEELERLLERAGEKPPFVFAGHSYGGLLAANFARRYPKQTAALILLDPTPPDVFLYLPGGGGPALPRAIEKGRFRQGLMKLFGLSEWTAPPAAPQDPLTRAIDAALAEVRPAMDARDYGPVSAFVEASLFEEWRSPGAISELVVYDGELSNTPLFLITPGGNSREELQQALGVTGETLDRAMQFLQRARMRYLAASSKSEWIESPAGTGHNFPYEAPEFTIGAVRRVLRQFAVTP